MTRTTADSSRPATIALAGHGYWGRNIARNLSALGALAAVVDADAATRAIVAETYPEVSVHADLHTVLEDPAIRAVALATPAATHAELATRVLRAGKDVFVEKPLALTVAEGAALVSEAEARGAILMVGHLLEYHPAVLELERLLLDGELGALRYVYSNRLNWGRLRREENILWSFAPHDIAVILRLVGETPSRVWATGGDWLQPSVHDVTVTHLEFPSGVRAHIFVSWLHPHKEQRMVVSGDRSVIVFEDSAAKRERKLRRYDHRVEWRDRSPVAHKEPETPLPFGTEEPLRRECSAFLEAIATRRPPPTDGHSALRVLQVLAAAQRSLSDGGAWVRIEATAANPDAPFVHPTSAVDPGAEIGARSRVWHFSHVSARSSAGDDCVLGQNTFVAPGVRLGRGCRIQNNVSLYDGVVLEEEVFVGPSAVFTNVKHPRAHVGRKSEFAETLVGRRASIGANATIVCGTRIGHHAFVGAGAVVTRDVPAHAVVVGNPARQRGWACACGEVLPPAGEDGVMGCERCRGKWRERGGALCAFD